ncbi:uncharacterized protein LOC119077707 isoform X2 [Bradysia coprophila]|uniref:uncharacterized protein LOC119077707 isoform X2 n=1 Tax=Bradysia coprophila TaxID=38358 RepID=UPI00187DA8A2|nr:uncharacterized protein LOC119077707 isoform X2 [Bradysia coprophila]
MTSSGSKMLILFVTFIIMNSINISSAGETPKQNEVIESTMLTKVIHNIGELFYGPEIEGSRTFARIKKLQAALLPIMFKLGVMATVVKIILLLSLKAVLIGKLLLFINVGFIIAKLATWKAQEHHHGWQQPSWSGPWQSPSWYPPPQPIHVHIHSHDKEPPHPHYSEHDQPHYKENDQPYLPYSSPNNSPSLGHYDRLDIGPVSKSSSYAEQYSDRNPQRYYGRK